jgi:putative endonuclease
LCRSDNIVPTVQKRRYYVYLIQSGSRRALYTGMSGFFEKRVWQHKTEENDGFTARYKVDRLVYFESYDRVHVAASREKEVKGWRRAKKEALVSRVNPEWRDLSEGWFDLSLLEKVRAINLRERELMLAAERSARSLAAKDAAQDDTSEKE